MRLWVVSLCLVATSAQWTTTGVQTATVATAPLFTTTATSPTPALKAKAVAATATTTAAPSYFQLSSSSRPGYCLERDKQSIKVDLCNDKKNQQLAWTKNANGERVIMFENGSCLSASSDLVDCAIAPTAVSDVGSTVRIAIGINCLTANTGATPPSFTPCGRGNNQYWAMRQQEATAKAPSKEPSYAFDQNVLRSYNLVVDTKSLNHDPFAEQYSSCSMTTDYGTSTAETHTLLGCRYKGSIGSLRACFDRLGRFDKTQCRHLAIKVSTTWQRKGKKGEPNEPLKIFGMEIFNFNSMPVDYSLMAERTMYGAFAEVGSAVSRAMHVKLYLNGAYYGIMMLAEEVDKIWSKQRFADDFNGGEGAIYKEIFPKYTDRNAYEANFEGGVNEHDFMVEVARAVNAATDRTAEQVMNKYFDVQSIANMIAMNAIAGATDDWRLRHNFYWYVRTEAVLVNATTYRGDLSQAKKQKDLYLVPTGKKQLVFIPWDYDRLYDMTLQTIGLPPLVARSGRLDYSSNPTQWGQQITTETNWWELYDPVYDPRCKPTMPPLPDIPDFLSQVPPDWTIPVQCEKLTRLWALVVRKVANNRILEISGQGLSSAELQRRQRAGAKGIAVMTDTPLQNKWNTWAAQIQSAALSDPNGPDQDTWFRAMLALSYHIAKYRNGAVRTALSYY